MTIEANSLHVAFFMQDTGSIYGAERATIDLVALLIPDVRVSVYLMQENRLGLTRSVLREAFEGLNVPVTAFPVQSAFSFNLIKAVRQAVRADGVNVLHCIGYKADVHGGLAARFGRVIPVVSTVHGWLFRSDLKERMYAKLNLWVLRRMQGVVVLSRHYEALLKEQSVPGKILQRIPSGYPAPERQDAREVHRPFTVGMLGRFSWEKNHAMLVRVAALCRNRKRGVRLLVAGSGPEESAVREAMQAAGVADLVELKSYMPTAEFFASVDVLVMCSRIENLPYSILEAMAAGVPVVATRVGGIPDLVEDGHTGYLLDVDDDAGMADRLAALALDQTLWQRLGAAGRDKLEQDFRPEQMRQAYVKMYARAM